MSTELTVPPTRITPVHGTRGGSVPPAERLKLGDALVRGGVITPAQLQQCLAAQQSASPPRRLGAVVVERGFATEVDIARGLASILGFEYVDVDMLDVPLDVVQRLPRYRAEALCAVPIGAGETWVRVAVADPSDREMVEALRSATGAVSVSLAVGTPSAIEGAIARLWSPGYAPPAPAPEPAAPAASPAPAPARTDGWMYAFVGDALPAGHAGRTDDLAGTERALARLGAEGWEAVGVHATDAGLVVLLKRPR